MKKYLFKPVFLAALAVIALSGCRKETNETVDKDTSAAEDNAAAENISSDIVAIASQAADETSSSLNSFRLEDASSVLSSCATVTHDAVNHIVTVTFNGTPCIDGRTRSGVLTFNYSASPVGSRHYRDPGFTCTITSTNYVVDGNQVNIVNHTITNTTNGSDPLTFNPATTNETWHITADININRPNGASITWNCDRTKELLNTSSVCPASDFVNFPTNDSIPINWLQARVGITGSATGTRSLNNVTESASVNITSMMIRDFGWCNINGRHPFFMGSLDYTRSGHPTRHLEYGSDATGNINNACDLWVQITFTVNNNTYTVYRQL